MTEAYPLTWPEGWPRTAFNRRESDRRFGGSRKLTMGRARDDLIHELRLLGATDIIVSSNIPTKSDGLPYSEARLIDDPGVAVYFTFKKKPLVMARDGFISVAGNIRSLTLAIEGLRQLERHGGSHMMEKAFSGFVAIAAPNAKKRWREVFGVKPDWHGDIAALYREKARHRHPDTGGDHAIMAELNNAYEDAKRELGVASAA
jgi:hypothetical protein